MKDLMREEIDEVGGGGGWFIVSIVTLVGAVGLGIYNGYNDAAKEAKDKPKTEEPK